MSSYTHRGITLTSTNNENPTKNISKLYNNFFETSDNFLRNMFTKLFI